jgi:hypothetical protein
MAYVSGDVVKSRVLVLENIYSPKRFEDLNLGTKLGYASIRYNQTVPFIDTDLKKAFAMLYLEYFYDDHWLLHLAYENRFDLDTLRLRAEYFSSIDNLSFFCELQESSNDYDHAMVGVRYHFGNKGKANDSKNNESVRKKRRHFSNSVQEILHGIGVYGALYNKNGNRYAREQNLNANFNQYGVENSLVGGPHELDIIRDFNKKSVSDNIIIKPEIIEADGTSEAALRIEVIEPEL